jgi:OOP family OmpA-OmpF porin
MRATLVKSLGVAFVVALALGFATEAQAQGVYLGGAYSWATLDVDEVDANLLDDNANAYKLFLGYEFPKILGFEAGYVDFGSYDVGEFEEEGPAGSVESNGWTVALTGRIPLGKLFTVYGKVGYFFWDAELQAAQDIGDLTDSGEDLFYGAGVRVNFGKFSILGEYEQFDGSEFKNDLFSLGLRFTF